MDKSEVERVCERQPEPGGEDGHQGTAPVGGGWIRISYERGDGWLQVQYILFGSGGHIYGFFDGELSREAERWHNNVYETQRLDYGINRVGMVPRRSWQFTRMVGEMDVERGRRLVGFGLVPG